MKFEDPATGELIENRGWIERLTDEPEVNIVVLLMKCRLLFLLSFGVSTEALIFYRKPKGE